MLFMLCLDAGPAASGQIVLTSQSPYWTVGERDNELSRAWSLSNFGPRRLDELGARFTEAEGQGQRPQSP